MDIVRDKETGALILNYNQKELEEDVGYRLLNLEKRVTELEKILKNIILKLDSIKSI